MGTGQGKAVPKPPPAPQADTPPVTPAPKVVSREGCQDKNTQKEVPAADIAALLDQIDINEKPDEAPVEEFDEPILLKDAPLADAPMADLAVLLDQINLEADSYQ